MDTTIAMEPEEVTEINAGLFAVRDLARRGNAGSSSVRRLNLHGNRIKKFELREIFDMFPSTEEVNFSSNDVSAFLE